MGYPADTDEGSRIIIVDKLAGDPEVLVAEDGSKWQKGPTSNLVRIAASADSPEADSEVAVTADETEAQVPEDSVEYLDDPSAEDDPLGNPLAEEESDEEDDESVG
jgi:hypothetical protein